MWKCKITLAREKRKENKGERIEEREKSSHGGAGLAEDMGEENKEQRKKIKRKKEEGYAQPSCYAQYIIWITKTKLLYWTMFPPPGLKAETAHTTAEAIIGQLVDRNRRLRDVETLLFLTFLSFTFSFIFCYCFVHTAPTLVYLPGPVYAATNSSEKPIVPEPGPVMGAAAPRVTSSRLSLSAKALLPIVVAIGR